MASVIRLNPNFKKKIVRLKAAVEEAAAEAMQAGIKFATIEAQEQYRWEPNRNNKSAWSGDGWEWEVTGLSRDSIQGLVISRPILDKAKQLAPRGSWTWHTEKGQRREIWHNQRKTMRYPLPKAKKNLIVAKLIMNTEYAQWLQYKEINGSNSGMGTGEPIVSETMKKRWRTFIFPQIVVPAFWVALRKRM